jgi:tetratricopeptide (TPR) repeat protein
MTKKYISLLAAIIILITWYLLPRYATDVTIQRNTIKPTNILADQQAPMTQPKPETSSQKETDSKSGLITNEDSKQIRIGTLEKSAIDKNAMMSSFESNIRKDDICLLFENIEKFEKTPGFLDSLLETSKKNSLYYRAGDRLLSQLFYPDTVTKLESEDETFVRALQLSGRFQNYSKKNYLESYKVFEKLMQTNPTNGLYPFFQIVNLNELNKTNEIPLLLEKLINSDNFDYFYLKLNIGIWENSLDRFTSFYLMQNIISHLPLPDFILPMKQILRLEIDPTTKTRLVHRLERELERVVNLKGQFTNLAWDRLLYTIFMRIHQKWTGKKSIYPKYNKLMRDSTDYAVLLRQEKVLEQIKTDCHVVMVEQEVEKDREWFKKFLSVTSKK